MYICIYVYMYICMYVCMYIYIYIYIYIVVPSASAVFRFELCQKITARRRSTCQARNEESLSLNGGGEDAV